VLVTISHVEYSADQDTHRPPGGDACLTAQVKQAPERPAYSRTHLARIPHSCSNNRWARRCLDSGETVIGRIPKNVGPSDEALSLIAVRLGETEQASSSDRNPSEAGAMALSLACWYPCAHATACSSLAREQGR